MEAHPFLLSFSAQTTWVIFHVALLCLPRPVSVMNLFFWISLCPALTATPAHGQPAKCSGRSSLTSSSNALLRHLLIWLSAAPPVPSLQLLGCLNALMLLSEDEEDNCVAMRKMVLHQSRTSLLGLVLIQVLFIHREVWQLTWETWKHFLDLIGFLVVFFDEGLYWLNNISLCWIKYLHRWEESDHYLVMSYESDFFWGHLYWPAQPVGLVWYVT